MRCARAEQLIALESDGRLAAREADALQHHIGLCERCAVYRDHMSAVLKTLELDVRAEALGDDLPSRFPAKLHAALVDENVRRSSEAQFRPLVLLNRAVSSSLSMPLRIMRGAVALACLLVFGFYVAAALLTPPAKPGTIRSFGHLAAFSVETRNDGRVYAALTDHQSIGRSNLREGGAR